MGKNKGQVIMSANTNYAEQKKKAIGNPNKNIHAKKKNSNYGGYRATQAAEKQKNTPKKAPVPKWIRTTITILAVIMTIMLILQMTVFKDNDMFMGINSIYISIVLIFLFYTRSQTYQREKTTFSTVVSVVIVASVMLYLYTGIATVFHLN